MYLHKVAEKLSEFTIPQPPNATVLAFDRVTGACLGIVIRTEDRRGRAIPGWLLWTIHAIYIWDGIYANALPPNRVSLSWTIG